MILFELFAQLLRICGIEFLVPMLEIASLLREAALYFLSDGELSFDNPVSLT